MLTIDISAVKANWLKLQSIGAGVAVAGVIKANAYGLGAEKVGRALYDVGCREFFLASIDEALSARAFLPSDVTIYLLGGIGFGNESLLINSKITPVLCTFTALSNWAKINTALGTLSPSAIKINTGMNRFGLDLKEFEDLCSNADLLRAANPCLIMSHLACAEQPHHPLNTQQRDAFSGCVNSVKSIIPGLRFSLANSSGIFLGNKWYFDLLRPGAALYGINPTHGAPNPMSSVVRLSLPITQVRKLDTAGTVGYGGTVTLPAGARIAVVAGGYADGIHRTLGLQPEAYINGIMVNAAGRISMDSAVFDVSAIDLPDDQLIGTKAEVINESLSLDYLSKKNGLLGYEVLTSLGNRYQRCYVAD